MRKATIIIVMLLMASSALAQHGLPHKFKGDVVVNGQPAQDGLVVTARVDGKDVAATTTSGGSYGYSPDIFYVENPYFSMSEGETIELFVQGIYAAEEEFVNGMSTELDLSVEGNFCGDGICTGGETCSSCSRDCGTCRRSGGGGGGSSSSPVVTQTIQTEEEETTEEETVEESVEVIEVTEDCTPSWSCTDWFACVGGVQKRLCTDSNNCGTDEGKPSERQECEIPEEFTVPVQDRESTFSKITGAVLGGGTATWAAGIALLGVLAGIFYYNRKKI
jgi:hypothetical protein